MTLVACGLSLAGCASQAKNWAFNDGLGHHSDASHTGSLLASDGDDSDATQGDPNRNVSLAPVVRTYTPSAR
jgi:hypothetical protein